MQCIVTAGPTYEKLDEVRRLTNFSSGRLGTELAAFLAAHGHEVVLLIGEQATWRGERIASDIREFSTTRDLQDQLETLGGNSVDAVFHAAAVSDFAFGKVFERNEDGSLNEANEGKVSTRTGTLLAELIPTPKILASLRNGYPRATIVGWKFEVDGSREDVVNKAAQQIREYSTNACVANGPAYGDGFGVLDKSGTLVHAGDRPTLFERLLQLPVT